MSHDPFTHTQSAVDIVASSPHPANKVAATLSTPDGFTISKVNHWPESITEKIGTDTKIGNSSSTIHAETACLIEAMQGAHKTYGANLFVTDPPCPNCAKNMAEAGIANIYIDHKGFEKDFAQRRGEDFKTLSLQVFEHAGINVFEIFRKTQDIIPIIEIPADYKPAQINAPYIETADPVIPLKDHIAKIKKLYEEKSFALCTGKNKNGEHFLIAAQSHPSLGYNTETKFKKDGNLSKYSTALEPVNRLLMLAARHGITIEKNSLFTTRTPTSRELVNIVGAGFKTITIQDKNDCRDEWGMQALKQLIDSKILNTQ